MFAAITVKAKWAGDDETLPAGCDVEILAADPMGRMTRDGECEVPARTACWIRWWPERRDYPSYRSCDLGDLEMSDEDFAQVSTKGIPGYQDVFTSGEQGNITIKAHEGMTTTIGTEWDEKTSRWHVTSIAATPIPAAPS